MTNYIASLAAAVALLAGACHAADTPPAPKPARGQTRCRDARGRSRTRRQRRGAALRAGRRAAASRSPSMQAGAASQGHVQAVQPPSSPTTRRSRRRAASM